MKERNAPLPRVPWVGVSLIKIALELTDAARTDVTSSVPQSKLQLCPPLSKEKSEILAHAETLEDQDDQVVQEWQDATAAEVMPELQAKQDEKDLEEDQAHPDQVAVLLDSKVWRSDLLENAKITKDLVQQSEDLEKEEM